MYIQNSNSFLYSAQGENVASAQRKEPGVKATGAPVLENFGEKATLVFQNLSSGLSAQERNEAVETLNSIGKAAAFSSINGFESQSERMVVSQYFENFGGVLSDEAIKKMIFSKLDNPQIKNRDFLENFAKALDEPLQSINIRV